MSFISIFFSDIDTCSKPQTQVIKKRKPQIWKHIKKTSKEDALPDDFLET
jgi:hypothetical protein